MMDTFFYFLKPLVLTILFEGIMAYLLGLRKKDLLLTVEVNLITNPVLVLLCSFLMYHIGVRTGRIITYVLLEPVVILIEAYIYRHYLEAERDPLLLSFLLNLTSILGGVLCRIVW